MSSTRTNGRPSSGRCRGSCRLGDMVDVDECGGACGSNFRRRASTGRTIAAWLWPSRIARGPGKIGLAQGLADRACPRRRKVLAMPPPMTSRSTLATRLPSRSSLVETLAPPTIAITGRSGCGAQRQRLQFRLHVGRRRPAAVRQTLGRGVRAVRGRKASLTKRSPSRRARGESGSFFSSSLWKRVFSSSSTSPGFIAATAVVSWRANAVVGESGRPPSGSATASTTDDQEIAASVTPWGGRNARSGSPSRPCRDQPDGRGDALDAGGVGDTAAFHRHVQIHAQETPVLPLTFRSSRVRNGFAHGSTSQSVGRQRSIPVRCRFCHAR